MGRRGWPCGRYGRRRQDYGFKRWDAGFWQRAKRLHRSGIYRLGRSEGGPLNAVRSPGYGSRLLRQPSLQRWPARGGVFQETRRLGGERIAVFLAAEQIEPLARNHPKARVARIGHPSPEIDRVVAAELRPVDFRMRHERGAVALVAETPDGASLARFEGDRPLGRHRFREIGD